MAVSAAVKDLGEKGAAWREAHPAPKGWPTAPRDLIDYHDGQGWLTQLEVAQLPLDVLDGIKTDKAWWLAVGCDEARVRVLVGRIKAATKRLWLWDAAHESAAELVGKGAKTMDFVHLDRRFLHAIDRLGPTEELSLAGATAAHIAQALQTPKLQRLRLIEPTASIADLMAHRPANVEISSEAFAWSKGYLRLSPEALASEPPRDKSLKVLVVRGPGPVDAARLTTWAAEVTDLALERLPGVAIESFVHKKLKKLRLFDCGIADPGIVAKLRSLAPKLEALDLSLNPLPALHDDRVRIAQVRQDLAPAALPSEEAFQRVASASAADRRVLLLAWGARVARNLQTALDFVPGATGPASKLAKAEKEEMWINRLWAVQDANPARHDHALFEVQHWSSFKGGFNTLSRRCAEVVQSDWERASQTAAGLAKVAGIVAQSEFLARHWHPLLPAPSAGQGVYEPLDATTVIADLEALASNAETPLPATLPFADRHDRMERQILFAIRWGLRALTRLILELPKPQAKPLRDLREQAYLGDVGVFMEALPSALLAVDAPRAKSLARAIAELASGLMGQDPRALGAFAHRLRAWHGLPCEAEAQTRDLQAQAHRASWRDYDEAALAAWFALLAPRLAAPVPDAVGKALSRGKLTAPEPVGAVDDAWSHQWVTWLDLLAHAGRQRGELAILAGRHMAEWVGRDALFASVPKGARYERLGLHAHREAGIKLYDALPRHMDWSIADPLLDRWARDIVARVDAQVANPALRAVLDTWSVGAGNRMATRWPTFEPLVEPIVDPWLRALDAVDALHAAAPTPTLDQARWGLANLCRGALDPDDSKAWFEAVAGSWLALVPGQTAEGLSREVAAAFVGAQA